ncbi:MAG: sigma-54 dependent transcriptional regulator [Pseudomonadota bacterium]
MKPIIISESMIEISNIVKSIKGKNSSVLITGESGVGKDVIARMINEIEGNSSRPFIAINCASIPETLLESTLFGHEKGAFSGACKTVPGKFELAFDGDIFFDEIGCFPLNLQSKLLRAIEAKEIERLGSTTTRKINCRIIAATNEKLEKLVMQGNFRRDLFYRLDVIRINIPPLRNRIEDILPCAKFFLKQCQREDIYFTEDAIHKLKSYPWPGNLRELKNLINRISVFCDFPRIQAQDINLNKNTLPLIENKKDLILSVKSSEKEHISDILKRNNGCKLKTQKDLNISRATLYRKLKKHEINRYLPF